MRAASAAAPNPRGRRASTNPDDPQPPAYLYGRWLGVVQELADAAGTRDHYDKLLMLASQSTTGYPALRRQTVEWLKRLTRRDQSQADQMRSCLDEADPAAAVAALGARHLHMPEQSQVWVGLHHAVRDATR